MKMFKKIMAVALTAVMAVSMLTGCAVSDAIAQSQLKDAMKAAGAALDVEYEVVSGEKTINNTKVNLSKKAENYAKDLAKQETVKGADGAYECEVKDGIVYVVVVAPKSGDNKYMKQATAATVDLLAKAYGETKSNGKTGIKIAMKSNTTKAAKENGKAYDFIVVTALAK